MWHAAADRGSDRDPRQRHRRRRPLPSLSSRDLPRKSVNLNNCCGERMTSGLVARARTSFAMGERERLKPRRAGTLGSLFSLPLCVFMSKTGRTGDEMLKTRWRTRALVLVGRRRAARGLLSSYELVPGLPRGREISWFLRGHVRKRQHVRVRGPGRDHDAWTSRRARLRAWRRRFGLRRVA